jgi:hypothetical protein
MIQVDCCKEMFTLKKNRKTQTTSDNQTNKEQEDNNK